MKSPLSISFGCDSYGLDSEKLAITAGMNGELEHSTFFFFSSSERCFSSYPSPELE